MDNIRHQGEQFTQTEDITYHSFSWTPRGIYFISGYEDGTDIASWNCLSDSGFKVSSLNQSLNMDLWVNTDSVPPASVSMKFLNLWYYKYDVDIVYTGKVLKVAQKPSETFCHNFCKSEQYFNTWVWINGICTCLSSTTLASQYSPGAISWTNLGTLLFPNKNIIGYGLANSDVPATDPLACYEICNSNKNCNAFTWANDDGGVCYLKSATSITIVNSKDSPGVYSGLRCQLIQGVAFVGNYLQFNGKTSTAPADSANGCCVKCAVLNGCRAFTFENGVCQFKTKGDNSQNKSGAVSFAGVY